MKILQTKQFKKDINRVSKRGKSKEKLIEVLRILERGEDLPEKYRDHKLSGNWIGRRDCYVEPDWVLIYNVTEDLIILERTGSHSDLF